MSALRRCVATALITGAAALSLGVAPPAGAAIAMSPDILRGLCKKAGGVYQEGSENGAYTCNLKNGGAVYCPNGVTSSTDCHVVHAKGTSEPPLPGFPPKPEANAADEPAPSGPPVKALRPPPQEMG